MNSIKIVFSNYAAQKIKLKTQLYVLENFRILKLVLKEVSKGSNDSI